MRTVDVVGRSAVIVRADVTRDRKKAVFVNRDRGREGELPRFGNSRKTQASGARPPWNGL